MSFTPAIIGEGYSGWQLLRKQLPAQKQAYVATPTPQREAAYFRQKISGAVTAGDLVSDRTLLKVALTAFGLEADLNARAFVRKVLSDGVTGTSALANRLADKRYRAFASGFGLDGTGLPGTLDKEFVDKVIADFYTRSFEAAVGETNSTYRLALNANRELTEVARNSALTEDAKWFTIMGNKPLRTVFEKAFGFTASFGALDIDQQLQALKARATAIFGDSSVSQFSSPDRLEKLTRDYIIKSTSTGSSGSGAENALTLLRQATPGR